MPGADCRVVAENDESKLLINRQVRRWRFEYVDQRERNQHAAVKAAAKFLQEHTALFPPGFVPGNVPQLAILAIQVYVVLLKYFDGTGSMRNLPPAQEIAGIMVDVAKNASNGNHLHF